MPKYKSGDQRVHYGEPADREAEQLSAEQAAQQQAVIAPGTNGDPNDSIDDFPLVRDAGERAKAANGRSQPAKQQAPRAKPEQQTVDDTALNADENNDARHILTLEGGNLHNIATEAEAALIAAGAPLYSRSGDIVKPIVEDVPAFRGRRTRSRG